MPHEHLHHAMTACSTPPPPPTETDLVVPPPRLGRQQREQAAPVPAIEAPPAPCMHPQVVDLLAALEVERAARVRAEERADRLDQVVLNLSEALAARPPAAHVPQAVPLSPGDMGGHVPQVSPQSQRDETPVVPRGTSAAKGGKGGSATAAKKKPLSMTKWAVKKRRQRENQAERKEAAAEGAREVSPQNVPLSPGDMSPPVVPLGDAPARAAKPPAVRKASWKEPTTPSPDKEFLGWYEEERRRFHPNAADGLAPKLLPRWAEWFPRALAHPLIAGDVEKLRETCRRWFVDPWGRGLRTPCPASAFIADAVWPQHIPGQHEGAAPAQETPAEARRRADADVGRGEVPAALEVPDTPAGRAWAQVLEQMFEQRGGAAYIASRAQGIFRAVDLAGSCLVLEAPDKYALAMLEDGGGALNSAVRALGLELRATVAGQPAGHAAGGIQ